MAIDDLSQLNPIESEATRNEVAQILRQLHELVGRAPNYRGAKSTSADS